MATDERTADRLSRTPLWVLALIVPVIAAVAVLITRPTWMAPSQATGSDTVRIDNFAFGPPELHVTVGAKVVVLNADSTAHTLTAKGGRFDTGDVGSGKRVTITAPSVPGTYRYLCQIHPNMTGELLVSGS